MEIDDIRRELGLENLGPEDIDKIKLQLQTLNDTIRGGLRSANLKEYRNTYVINAQDSLDASYPMYVHFNIISEMIKIISIKISFWFLNFRAYSTAASSGGAVTSVSGGGETPTTSSGGDSTPTSGATSDVYPYTTYIITAVPAPELVHNIGDENVDGMIYHSAVTGLELVSSGHTHIVTITAHTHTVTIAAHTHVGGTHTHGITYGIFEDSTSPTVMFYVSKDNGKTYSLAAGSYTADQEELDITSFIDTVGGKMIKFTTSARTRLSVEIEIKLDIKARS